MPKFSKNALVFAKVKGYPSWPAIVTDYKNKRYDVKFYGTGETGAIKEEDLRYYLESKDQLVGKTANLRRKDYVDALAEIEKAFRKAKTDGSDSNDSDKVTVKLEKVEPARKLTTKRKSIVESENNIVPKRVSGKRKTFTSETSNDESNNDNDVVQEKIIRNLKEEPNENVEIEASADSTSKNRGGRKKIKKSSIEEEVESTFIPKNTKAQRNSLKKSIESKKSELDQNKNEDTSEIEKIYTIVPVDNLEILVKYFDAIKDKGEHFKKRSPEDLIPSSQKTQVVRAIVPGDAMFLGIPYHEKRMPKFNSEYDRAAYEAKEALRIIQLKADVENGVKSVEEVSSSCIPLDGKCTEVERNNILEDWLCQKQRKLQFLKIENDLLKCDCGIKNSLGLDKANTEVAIEQLKIIKSLPVQPLMLKKHPQVFEMVKRLQRYVGNIDAWKLDKKEADIFREGAKLVRVEADQVYDKFYTLMLKVLPSKDQINDTIFWTKFMEEVVRFQKETSHLKETEVFVISAEPCSRAAILDTLCQEIMSGNSIDETTSAVPDSSTSVILSKPFTDPTSSDADSSTTEAEARTTAVIS